MNTGDYLYSCGDYVLKTAEHTLLMPLASRFATFLGLLYVCISEFEPDRVTGRYKDQVPKPFCRE